LPKRGRSFLEALNVEEWLLSAKNGCDLVYLSEKLSYGRVGFLSTNWHRSFSTITDFYPI